MITVFTLIVWCNLRHRISAIWLLSFSSLLSGSVSDVGYHFLYDQCLLLHSCLVQPLMRGIIFLYDHCLLLHCCLVQPQAQDISYMITVFCFTVVWCSPRHRISVIWSLSFASLLSDAAQGTGYQLYDHCLLFHYCLMQPQAQDISYMISHLLHCCVVQPHAQDISYMITVFCFTVVWCSPRYMISVTWSLSFASLLSGAASHIGYLFTDYFYFNGRALVLHVCVCENIQKVYRYSVSQVRYHFFCDECLLLYYGWFSLISVVIIVFYFTHCCFTF